MLHTARSFISGLATVFFSQVAVSISGIVVDDDKFQAVIFAVLISASGGLAAALVPNDEKTWSWKGFTRLILLGVLVGIPTASFLGPHPIPIKWLTGADSDARPWVEFAAGVLAYPIIRLLQRTGPAKLLWAILDKFRPPAPPVDVDKE